MKENDCKESLLFRTISSSILLTFRRTISLTSPINLIPDSIFLNLEKYSPFFEIYTCPKFASYLPTSGLTECKLPPKIISRYPSLFISSVYIEWTEENWASIGIDILLKIPDLLMNIDVSKSKIRFRWLVFSFSIEKISLAVWFL